MIKHFCDGCGQEVGLSGPGLFTFQYLGHVDAILDHSQRVYVEPLSMEPVSGRTVETLLCAACYNSTVVPAVRSLRTLQCRNGLRPSDPKEPD